MSAATREYIYAYSSRFRYKTRVAPARGGRGVTPEIHGKMLCGKEIYQLTKQKLESRKNFLPVNYHYRDFGSYTPLAGTTSVGLTELANSRESRIKRFPPTIYIQNFNKQQ